MATASECDEAEIKIKDCGEKVTAMAWGVTNYPDCCICVTENGTLVPDRSQAGDWLLLFSDCQGLVFSASKMDVRCYRPQSLVATILLTAIFMA
jgi:hypothetical protein